MFVPLRYLSIDIKHILFTTKNILHSYHEDIRMLFLKLFYLYLMHLLRITPVPQRHLNVITQHKYFISMSTYS